MAKSVADIHRRRVPTREVRYPRQDGDGARADPVQDAMDMRREMVASKILEQTTHEAEADAAARISEIQTRRLEAEAKAEEAKARLAQLRQGTQQPQQQQTSDMMVLISEMLDTLKGQNQALQERMNTMQDQVLNSQIQTLQGEITALKQEIIARAAGPTDANVQTLASRIEEVKQAKEALDPFFGQVPQLAQVGGDINSLLLMQRISSENERWLAEFRAGQEDRRWSRELEWARFEAEKSRSQSIASALNRIAPTIAKMADQVVASPAGSQAASASTPTSLPCQAEGCSGMVNIVPGQEIAQCQVCNQQYQIRNTPG